MWRRVPSGFRFVREAFNPTSTSSMSLTGKTPSVQGFVVIFTACFAQFAQRHCPASLPEAFAVSSPVAIFFPPFWLSLAVGRVLVALDEITKPGDGVFLFDGIAGHVLQSSRHLNACLGIGFDDGAWIGSAYNIALARVCLHLDLRVRTLGSNSLAGNFRHHRSNLCKHLQHPDSERVRLGAGITTSPS